MHLGNINFGYQLKTFIGIRDGLVKILIGEISFPREVSRRFQTPLFISAILASMSPRWSPKYVTFVNELL